MMIKRTLLTMASLIAFIGTAMSQAKADGTIIEPAIAANAPDTIFIQSKEKTVFLTRGSDGKTREVTIFKPKQGPKAVGFDMLFEIGFNAYNDRNMFTGSDGNNPFLNLNTSKSVNVAVYPFYSTIKLTKNRVLNLETGLGVDWGNYRFEDGWTIANENGQTVASDKYRENGESLVSKSKLMTAYMNVPLMLSVKIPVGGSYRKGFSLSAGVIGGLKLGSHTKIKYSDDGDKVKDHSSFNLNLLRYDLRVRAEYRIIGLYANYQMSSMFESGKGPKLFPYSVGLSVRFGFEER